jgi:hypothetical protein
VVDTTVTTIQSVFGNTPLEGPILDVVNCVLLMKIEGIQNGLTFVNENAKVSFPRVDNSSLNIDLGSTGSALQSAQSPSQAAFSSLLDIMNGIITKWDAAIRRQAIIAGILLGVYAFVVLMGLARIVYMLRDRQKSHSEGGGLVTLGVHGVTWARNRFRPDTSNPFTNPKLEYEPGPTPSSRSK